MSELALVPGVETHTLFDGNITQYPETHFLDFVVDGRSFRDVVDGGAGQVTELSRPWLDTVPESVDRLLGRAGTPGLAQGRVALLVCLVCGDLGCGAITARLTITEAHVTWSEFAWEDGDGDPTPVDVGQEGNERMVFNRAAYDRLLASAPERIAAMPYEELEHQGRRFLWPWQWGWRLPRSDAGD